MKAQQSAQRQVEATTDSDVTWSGGSSVRPVDSGEQGHLPGNPRSKRERRGGSSNGYRGWNARLVALMAARAKTAIAADA